MQNSYWIIPMSSVGVEGDHMEESSPLLELDTEITPLLLDRKTATEAATDALRSLILSGAIAPGSQIRQDLLAKRLGVSRTPLREALQRLTVEGLIHLDHHRGAIAAAPSISELREIYELQEILECIAARDALKYCTDADLEELKGCIDLLAQAETSVEWIRGNLAFHSTMYRISEKKLVVDMITQLRNRAILYINMVARSNESRKRAEADHIEMVEVLSKGDGDRLEELIRSHLRATLAWVETIIV